MGHWWQVQPRNYILLGCHVANECVQGYNFQRWARWTQLDAQVEAAKVGLTLVHLSAQPEPFLTQNTP